MKIGEPTLEDIYREAKADLARGGADVALKWAFRHARAVARVTRAEQAAKLHDGDRFTLKMDLHERNPEAIDAMQALEQVTASLHADAIDLAEARAMETLCGHTLRLAERQAGRAAAPAPLAKPKAA